MTFAIGMKGVKEEQVSTLESLILKTLSNIVDVGFDNQDIAAAMNSLEFRVSDPSSCTDCRNGNKRIR
jgi:Zn-dependent M16 (insulinase) family peptidase